MQYYRIGGGWRAPTDHALDPYNGASLLEGGRGGEPCYTAKGDFFKTKKTF